MVSSLLPPHATVWSLECPIEDHGLSVHALIQIGADRELLQVHTHCSCPIEKVTDALRDEPVAEVYTKIMSRVVVFPTILPDRRN